MSSILNADGSTLVNQNFTAYGDRRNPTTWSGSASGDDLSVSAGVTRQGYTWQTALGNMGLNHMNGRVQDAITGVFLSPDPYISEPGNPQNYNRYSYVLNNPLSFTDPSGYRQQSRIRYVHGKRQSGRWHGTGLILTTFTGTNDENGKADYVTWEEGYYEPDYSSSPLGALFFHDASYFINSMVSDLINYDDGPANGGDGKNTVELAAQTKNTQDKSTSQILCDFAASADAPENQVAQGAAVAGAYDDLGRSFSAASRDLVALGNNISRVAGPLGTVLSAGQAAYQYSNGQYLDAAFTSADFLLAAALSTTGPLGIGLDVALNASGGTKAAAKGVARLGCMMMGGN